MWNSGSVILARNRTIWLLFAFSAISIGLYPVVYFLTDDQFGLLNTKTQDILASPVWRGFFYAHIAPGGIALGIGWIQFWKGFRLRYPARHRMLGKLYVVTALLSATAGMYLALHATGGIISGSGFFMLALIWFTSTTIAWQFARLGDFNRHRKAMIISYAICFAAVSLRVWLPLLEWFTGDFITAYRMVAWICWVPNLLFAVWIASR